MFSYRFRFALPLAICLILTGCASMVSNARVAPYPNASNYPATQSRNVHVYYMEPPFPYEVIGEIYGDTSANWAQLETVMRKKAAKIGAQGIIIRKQHSPSTTKHIPGQLTISTPTDPKNSGANSTANNILNTKVTFDAPRDETVYTHQMGGVIIRFKPVNS